MNRLACQRDMTNVRKAPFRVAWRLACLGGEVLLAFCRYLPEVLLQPPACRVLAQTRWMQSTARRFLAVLRVRMFVTGTPPSNGLVVSNHLGYLDILLLGATMPLVFVSKHEVKRWPVFGRLAQMAGTIFIERDRRLAVGEICAAMAAILAQGTPVVLFPEGTSTDGATVAPFRSSLLEPAVRSSRSVALACLRYSIGEGDVSREVCYWGDMVFFPHLVNLLGIKDISAFIHFMTATSASDRKTLAELWHGQLLAAVRTFDTVPVEEMADTLG